MNFPQRYRRKTEQFQDKMSQFYPELFAIKNTQRVVLARTVTFQVTDSCNLACTYCYQHNKSTRRMSLETAKKFIDLLLTGMYGFEDYINPEISPAVIIEFIGGEPLLEIDLISQIVDYFIDKCIKLDHPWLTKHMISMCSNGILYNTPKVQEFLERHKSRLSFSITLDGNKELHDACRVFPDGKPTYDIVSSAVNDWMSKGYQMGSKITIAPENVPYIFNAIKHMIDMGYKEILANCVFEPGWKSEHATIFYNRLKELSDYLIDNDMVDTIYISLFEEHFFTPMEESDNQNWCGGNGVTLACDPDGRIYPCVRFMESSLGPDIEAYNIGDVNSGIAKTKKESEHLRCLDCITRRSQSTDECFYCPIAHGCAWCTAFNYQDTGSPDKRVTYICIMHKARAMANAYLWSRWYAKHFPEYKYPLYIPEKWALEIISKEEFDNLINFDNLDYRGKKEA